MASVSGQATAGIGGTTVRGGIELKHVVALGVTLLFLGWVAYQLATRARDNADLTTPPDQPPDERDGGMAAALANLNPLDGSKNHQQVCMPQDHYGGYVFLPHRYPRTVGGDITATIHHGYSSMRLPAVDDITVWMANPPSEVPW